MAIFGDNGTKSGGTSLNKTSVKCRQFTIPENGNLTQISFFYSTSPTSDTYNTKVFIYADNGSNSPGALLGSAYGPQISQNFPGSWVNVDVSVSGLTAGSKYWLGWINDAPSGISTFFWSHSSGSGGTGKYKSVSDGYASTPNPYGTPTGDTPNTYLIYGTYTPTGGGGVTVTPSAFNLASAILAPVVSVQKQITISPNALSLNGALLAPNLAA
ncbi:MAG: hypothetical protein Q8R48_01925, partial [Candidatus Omnitrophota bacterium]|nr:hypothetical protein [Candidatus Omnitrophota bacterium]